MTPNARISPIVTAIAASSESSAGGDFDQSKAAQEAERAARYRLVIEEGPASGSFVYKTLDRVTGEIVRQFPREQIVRMLEEDAYAAGTVIDTTA